MSTLHPLVLPRPHATRCAPSHHGHPAVIPPELRWVPAGPFRTTFRLLVDSTGLPWRMVAGLARVPVPVAARLIGDRPHPRHRLRQVDAQRICLLTPGMVRSLRRARVPAATARRRLRRLERHCTREEIAQLTGLPRAELDRLAAAGTTECSALAPRLLHILEHELQESSVGPVNDDHERFGSLPAAA